MDTTTKMLHWEIPNSSAIYPTVNGQELSMNTPIPSTISANVRGPSGKKKILASYPLPPQMQNSSPYLNKQNFTYDDRILSINEG